MNKTIISIICCIFMVAAAVPLHVAAMNNAALSREQTFSHTPLQRERQDSGMRDGWELQWTHAYGGNGEAEFAQPIGDVDSDGVNEIIMGGYDVNSEARIMHYDTAQQTYVQEYSWDQAGGVPSGASIADLNGDGSLLLIVSWAYSSADGVYAYKYDGTTLTQLDYYHGTGVDFVFDIYSCDYDDDGALEVLIANAPNMGTGNYHVTALGWDAGSHTFIYETSWACPGGSNCECPMVWSGDVDNDGLTEVIADVSEDTTMTAGTWALNWNTDTQTWDGVAVWTDYGSSTVYGDGTGDIDGDGTLEIGIGCYGGTPQGWMFEWDGSTYQEVWNGVYPGGEPTIEAVGMGDADNDGKNEFCFATGDVHIIGWDGSSYVEEATLTDPTGMLAGMNIGDCDSDGRNELKGCEILSGTGSQFIWKYIIPDTLPPTTTYDLDGEMSDGVYISNVTVTLTATDEGSGVDFTKYKLDIGDWMIYTAPFVVSEDGNHTVSFYSVDRNGNIEPEKHCSFSIQQHQLLNVTVKGGKGISIIVENRGLILESKIPWNVGLKGGIILSGRSKTGLIPGLMPGETKTISSSVFGFGRVDITISVGDLQLTKKGFVILVFVLGVK